MHVCLCVCMSRFVRNKHEIRFGHPADQLQLSLCLLQTEKKGDKDTQTLDTKGEMKGMMSGLSCKDHQCFVSVWAIITRCNY